MQKPLTGRKTLLIALASFGVVFAVNGYMAAEAISTYTGEDADDAYVQGANYNQTIERRAKQTALGWHAAIEASRAANGKAMIMVRISQRNDHPVNRLNLTGLLRHPSDANRDQPLHMRELSPGVYGAPLNRVATGSWDVVVHTGPRDQPFEATRTVWFP